MPIYEYRCHTCQQKTSHFAKSFSAALPTSCPGCGSENLVRLISKFTIVKTIGSSLHMPSYESLSDVNEDDPKSMSRWLKDMRGEMGGEFGGDMEEMIHEMESESDSHGDEID
jgi:putative FmdB family regulatory protein